jgi:hypothetical protein
MDSRHSKIVIAIIAMVALASSTAFAATSSDKRKRDAEVPPAPLRIGVDDTWSLQMTDDEELTFQGVVDLDKAGLNSGQMMYPAPDPATFLVGLLIHGAVVDAQKKKQKAKMQAQADSVLAPYAEILQAYSPREMMTAGLQEMNAGVAGPLLDHGVRADTQWVFVSAPLFLMTQDRKALWLQNNFTIFAPQAAGEESSGATRKRSTRNKSKKDAVPVLYNATIRVLTDMHTADNLEEYWKADNGAVLKRESQKLFAESMRLLVRQLRGDLDRADAPQRTVRYMQGADEKMERAHVIEEHCTRVVARTLRGWITSVPVARKPDDQAHYCTQASPPAEPIAAAASPAAGESAPPLTAESQ